ARFRGKRALVMGLGLWQGGVEAVKFLHACGVSELLVTDLRDAATLERSLQAIAGIPVQLRLGEHLREDFERAEVVLHSAAVRPDHELLQLARARGAEVTQEMSLFIEACPAPTIGIPGSNGKTPTTLLCYEMLRRVFAPAQPDLWTQWADPVPPAEVPHCVEPPTALPRVWLGGNVGTPLINRLAEIRPDDIVLLELSSFQLQAWHGIRRSCSVGLITNITPNHLDWHRDLAEYTRAKTAVFCWPREQTEPACCTPAGPRLVFPPALLNRDDPALRALDVARFADCHAPATLPDALRARLAGVSKETPRVWYSAVEAAGYATPADEDYVAVSGAGGLLTVTGPDVLPDQPGQTRDGVRTVAVARRADLRLPGAFNWANAVAAVAAVWAGAPQALPEVAAALRTFRGAEHRLEPCGEVNGARVYNDSIGTDPAATMAALTAFEGSLRLILGGGSKKIDYAELGRRIAAHRGVKALYLQGPTGPAIRAAAQAAGAECPLGEYGSFDEACRAAFRDAQPGEVLLMSPASTSFYEYDTGKWFKNFEQRGLHFKRLVKAHCTNTTTGNLGELGARGHRDLQ
ncbi:MAG: hypothetical protein IT463_05470, partial [Planctomycetes bacterium]|nr:hypothetical protein [Planctomycetota bacterium]